MRPFTTLVSRAHVLLRDSIDTDMIIRIERLVLVPRRELGRYAFEMLRNNADGTPDPSHPLNAPELTGAEIIVTGRNFGCGSSREAAVWALAGFGIRTIIAPSFGDIFRSNVLKNGILPIQLDEATCQTIADAVAAGGEIKVDLEALCLTLPDGRTIPFAIAEHERQALMKGEDEVTLTLRHEGLIAGHFRQWHEQTPWAAIDADRMRAMTSSNSVEQGH